MTRKPVIILLVLRHRYDRAGRIVEKAETVLTDTVTTFSYTYDSVGRLAKVYRSVGSQTMTLMAEYAYDANGNRTAFTNHGGGALPSVAPAAVAVDDQDRLLRYGDWTFTYNRNGELLTKADGSTTFTFAYDPLGTLTGATVAADTSTTTIAYVIDPSGRRVGKKVGGSLVQGFLYLDAINPVAELDGSNAVMSVFVYASKGHVPDYLVKPSGQDAGTYRIVTDHLGSVRLVVDVADGTVAQRLDYDAFGNVVTDTNPGFQPFGFAGGLYDRETALVRFGARDYDPEVGRWTTKDPIGFEGGMNLYGYVESDPINLTDRFGYGPDRSNLQGGHYPLGLSHQWGTDSNYEFGYQLGKRGLPGFIVAPVSFYAEGVQSAVWMPKLLEGFLQPINPYYWYTEWVRDKSSGPWHSYLGTEPNYFWQKFSFGDIKRMTRGACDGFDALLESHSVPPNHNQHRSGNIDGLGYLEPGEPGSGWPSF